MPSRTTNRYAQHTIALAATRITLALLFLPMMVPTFTFAAPATTSPRWPSEHGHRGIALDSRHHAPAELRLSELKNTQQTGVLVVPNFYNDHRKTQSAKGRHTPSGASANGLQSRGPPKPEEAEAPMPQLVAPDSGQYDDDGVPRGTGQELQAHVGVLLPLTRPRERRHMHLDDEEPYRQVHVSFRTPLLTHSSSI